MEYTESKQIESLLTQVIYYRNGRHHELPVDIDALFYFLIGKMTTLAQLHKVVNACDRNWLWKKDDPRYQLLHKIGWLARKELLKRFEARMAAEKEVKI